MKSGQKAALVIRLFYEELAQEAKERMSLGGKGGVNEGVPDLEQVKTTGRTNEKLAKKSGVGKTNIAYLLAVYRNRPDLFERVFSGEYSINEALIIRLHYKDDGCARKRADECGRKDEGFTNW